jgi:poly(beta-D-mannuronate) lyase
MVLRHGQKCFVYGNYFDGKTGRGTSGGIRIINANQTVFNNYITNVEASAKDGSKSGIVIMSGLQGSPLNGYYPADNAVVAYNTIVNSEMPVIKIGYGNKSKGLPLVAPQNLTIVANALLYSVVNNNNLVVENETVAYLKCAENYYTNGATTIAGFLPLKNIKVKVEAGFCYTQLPLDDIIIDTINQRLVVHNIHLSKQDITQFNPAWKLTKKDVGVSWLH